MHTNDTEVITDDDFSAAFDEHEEGNSDEQGLRDTAPVEEEDNVVTDDDTQSDDEVLEVEDDDDDDIDTETSELEELRRKLADSQSEAKLHKSRLEDLSDRYRATRDSLEDLRYNVNTDKKEDKTTKAKPELELPESFKELQEVAPDFAKAVEELLSARLSNTTKAIDEKVNTYIAPVQQQMEAMTATTHKSRITAAHPDAWDIASSKEFDSWLDKLPTWERRSAELVVAQGSSEEVIELLDYYKEANNVVTSKSKNNASPANKDRKGKVDDELVKRVRGAQGVKSSRTNPKTDAAVDEIDMDDFDAGFKEQEKAFKETNIWR